MFKVGDVVSDNSPNGKYIFKIVEVSDVYLFEFICYFYQDQIIIGKHTKANISLNAVGWELVTNTLLNKIKSVYGIQDVVESSKQKVRNL